MRLKAGDRPSESRVIAEAIAKFPSTFGLAGFPGKVFRISQSASYISDYPATGTLHLYTEVQRGDQWLSFAKATLEELQVQVRGHFQGGCDGHS
jgi:hypothetical protein